MPDTKVKVFHNTIATTNEDTFYSWMKVADKNAWHPTHIEMEHQTLYILERKKPMTQSTLPQGNDNKTLLLIFAASAAIVITFLMIII